MWHRDRKRHILARRHIRWPIRLSKSVYRYGLGVSPRIKRSPKKPKHVTSSSSSSSRWSRTFLSGLNSANYCKDHCSGGEINSDNDWGKCNSKSNGFVAAAEQVCLEPVLEHRQRRGRRNIAWQTIPHLCSSNRKGTTSDSWPTTGRNVKLFNGGGPEPASVRHVGDTCEWLRQVRWCGTMQSTIRQRRHLECNSLRHEEPMKAD